MLIPDLDELIAFGSYPEITGVHPAANLFPLQTEAEFQLMADDIDKTGLIDAIVLTTEGLLVDGRNRILACAATESEPKFRRISTEFIDPFEFAVSANLHRRHLTTGQQAAVGAELEDHFAVEAKKRQLAAQNNDAGRAVPANFPELGDRGDARDKAAEAVGCSGRSISTYKAVKDAAPDVAAEVAAGNMTLNEGHKEATKRKKAQEAIVPKTNEDKTPVTAQTTPVICVDGRSVEIALPKAVKFNRTNDNVDWASWTWNPVTGCNHGCDFCYAREIALQGKMRPFYPFGFEPAFHEARLAAPKNTSVPQSARDRDGRVFVCSMADLFGKWVPDEWIDRVFDACEAAPDWEYLFLTKWPARYARRPLMATAWYGASIVKQSDVARVEQGMSAFQAPEGSVKWVSLEPFVEPIKFNDLSWCDWIVIGAQTGTAQPTGYVPEASPDLDWLVDVVNQCREAGVPYYVKENLGLISPGLSLPKTPPKGR